MYLGMDRAGLSHVHDSQRHGNNDANTRKDESYLGTKNVKELCNLYSVSVIMYMNHSCDIYNKD